VKSKKLISLIATLIVAFTLSISLMLSASADDSKMIFVDGYGTTTGSGTQSDPYNSILPALVDLETTRNIIYIINPVTITANTTLEPSDPAVTNAVIQRSDDNPTDYLFVVTNGATLTVNAITLDGSNGIASTPKAAIINADGGDVQINAGATLQNNNSLLLGGAIDVTNESSTVTVAGGTIQDNTGINGGAIYSIGTVFVSGGNISNNTATTFGGGIYSLGNTTISGGLIFGNTAPSGGGIYSDEGSNAILTITSSANITENSARIDGGNVAVFGTLMMDGGTVSSNVTNSDSGGGIYLGSNAAAGTGAYAEISGGIISSNTANRGAGVYVDNFAELKLSGSAQIIKNTSFNSGGGVTSAGIFTMEGGSITGNIANSGGGVSAMASTGSSPAGTFTMSGGTISGNNAQRTDGGGVNVATGAIFDLISGTSAAPVINSNQANRNGGGVFVAANATFTQDAGTIGGISGSDANTAVEDGGGVFVSNTGIYNLQNGSVLGNSAQINGGDIAIESTISAIATVNTTSTLNITGGTISSNSAGANGGGIFAIGAANAANFTATSVVNISVVTSSSNTAPNGGGIYDGAYAKVTITSVTINLNTASTNGVGIYFANLGVLSFNPASSGSPTFAIQDNVYIENGAVITLLSSLTTTSTAYPITVVVPTTPTGVRLFANGTSTIAGNSYQRFVSAQGYVISRVTGNIRIAVS
jgi:predicted outer membrane repeat protein